MLTLLITLASLLPNAYATVDFHENVYIVVQNIQTPDRFMVQKAPVIGCLGLNQSARLQQWTHDYLATTNIGCGGTPVSQNINYLTCAKVTSATESADFNSYAEITLDISKCDQKDNRKFITKVRTSAKWNFPQSNKTTEVKLTLVK